MYSDISILIIAFSSLNKKSASDLASSVFQTQVGQRKINDQTGRFGSLSQALARLIAFDTETTASDCHITF